MSRLRPCDRCSQFSRKCLNMAVWSQMFIHFRWILKFKGQGLIDNGLGSPFSEFGGSCLNSVHLGNGPDIASSYLHCLKKKKNKHTNLWDKHTLTGRINQVAWAGKYIYINILCVYINTHKQGYWFWGEKSIFLWKIAILTQFFLSQPLMEWNSW